MADMKHLNKENWKLVPKSKSILKNSCNNNNNKNMFLVAKNNITAIGTGTNQSRQVNGSFSWFNSAKCQSSSL